MQGDSEHLDSFLCGQPAYCRPICVQLFKVQISEKERKDPSGPAKSSLVQEEEPLEWHLQQPCKPWRTMVSVLCRKEEAWSVWTHIAEVLHVEVEYNEIMFLRQTCFLCGLVSFTIAGRDVLPKATQGRKQKRKSSLILHNDTQHSATCIHISLRIFF